MSFFKAVYDSFEAIPDLEINGHKLRSFFESKGGKWVLKAEAIEGAAEALNPGLADNRDRALTQLKAANDRVTELTGQLAEAQRSAANQNAPGSVVLSPEDARTWNKYQELGTPTELKRIKEEHPTLVAQVEGSKREAALQTLATETGLNFEVLRDWAKNRTDVELYSKEVERDGKKVKVLAGKVSRKVGDKTEVTEQDFDQLTGDMPSYMKAALTTAAAAGGAGDGKDKQETRPQGGVRLPALGGQSASAGKGAGEGKSLVDEFNAQRAKKPNPLKPAPTNAGS